MIMWKSKEKEREYNKEYRANNKDKAKQYSKEYATDYSKRDYVKEYRKIFMKKYREKNKEALKLYHNNYMKSRISTDINYKLALNLRIKINKLVRSTNKSKHTLDLLGCSIEWFKMHLEKRFYADMSWENYGQYWHIDHIRPCCSFDLSTPEQQAICFHYTNMQPLTKKDNLSKGGRFK